MVDGIVKWFSDDKGYGFIASGNKDYFVHFSDVQSDGFKSLKEGDNVSFEATNSSRGWTAKNVKKNS